MDPPDPLGMCLADTLRAPSDSVERRPFWMANDGNTLRHLLSLRVFRSNSVLCLISGQQQPTFCGRRVLWEVTVDVNAIPSAKALHDVNDVVAVALQCVA